MSNQTNTNYEGRVGFCVGTGRCGTTFLAEVVDREPEVAAAHERERLAATFHMFCKWHNIPIDSEGFLHAKESEIRPDLETHRFSFESSALLSHSLEELYDRFRARFLLLVRSPAETVASFAVRGWFLRTPVRSDTTLPPSHAGSEEARHFLGRNIPNGPEFERWAGLTQIGRLAWFWQARNRAILEQFHRLPKSHCRVVRLEELDFDEYQEIAHHFGWRSQVDRDTFSELVQTRPNAGPNTPRLFMDWTPKESAEFEAEVAPVATALGYEYQVGILAKQPGLGVHKERPPLPAILAHLF
ncbi:MAG: hypothetical protein ACFCD0_10445 [Gemmataceae bacterium]